MKIKKKTSILLVFFFLFVGVLFISNTFSLFISNGESNKPNIVEREIIIATNLIKPKRNDFVIFELPDNTKNKFVSRLVGKPSDTIVISRGLLYRNGDIIDSDLILSFDYLISLKQYHEFVNKNLIKRELNLRKISKDSVLINLSENIELSEAICSQKFILSNTVIDKKIEKTYNEPWNIDNFGELIIPNDKYFFVGDNRHNSYDSRHFGFVDQKDLIGVVIW